MDSNKSEIDTYQHNKALVSYRDYYKSLPNPHVNVFDDPRADLSYYFFSLEAVHLSFSSYTSSNAINCSVFFTASIIGWLCELELNWETFWSFVLA